MTPHASFENLLLTLSVWDEAASVWYTLDQEATPEDIEAWTLYTEPIALESDCIVRFFSRRIGFLDSQIATYEFVYADWQVAAPEISAEGATVTITCQTEDAMILYTIDGSEPTAESAEYTEPIVIPGNCTVKAIATQGGMFDSEISTLVVSDMTVASPTAEFENLALILSVEDAHAQIFYTTDENAAVEDAEAWTLYTEPITFDADCTVRYFARRDAYNDSEVNTFNHVYADWQVATPEIAEDTDNYTIIMTCMTEGAEIRYTIDGSEPTEESELYTEPIEITRDMTIRARAFAEGFYSSEVSDLPVADSAVSTP